MAQCKDCIHGEICDMFAHTRTLICTDRADKMCKMFKSIADVVPKSEVAELKAIIADHKANEERWQELYADTVSKWEKAYEELEIKLDNAKTDVAREIFEDIKTCMKNFEDDDDSYLLKKCEFEFLCENSKRYTEDKE